MSRAVMNNSEIALHFRGGNVLKPGMAFFDPNGSRLDTGFYLEEDGSLSVSIDGTKVFSFAGGGASELFIDGTVAAPGIAFINDPATGFYRNSTPSHMFLALGGATGIEWTKQSGPIQTLFANGTQTVPTVSFSSGTGTGFSYGGAAGRTTVVANGTAIANFNSGGQQFAAGASLAWTSAATADYSTNDTILWRDAANTLAFRNGVNAQIFRVYNTFTDASNYERGFVRWNSNIFEIGNEFLGTGATRDLRILAGTGASTIWFQAGGTDRWRLSNAGHLFTVADVSYDLGAAAGFVRDIYYRRHITKIAAVTYSASMTPDASLGDAQTITVTNATAFTINAPTNPLTGQYLEILIRNTSGGAAGVATWNAVFKMTAWTQPATGFSRVIMFRYDGANWIEVDRGAADVPN